MLDTEPKSSRLAKQFKEKGAGGHTAQCPLCASISVVADLFSQSGKLPLVQARLGYPTLEDAIGSAASWVRVIAAFVAAVFNPHRFHRLKANDCGLASIDDPIVQTQRELSERRQEIV